MPSPESGTTQDRVDPAVLRRAITGAAVGNAVEWFDFAVYGFNDCVSTMLQCFFKHILNP
jgi:hypothetical protein